MTTTSIQEVLVCPFLFDEEFLVAVVLRRGRQCYLLTTLNGLVASISGSSDGIQTISEALKLPCRLLEGPEGALLAHKTIIAECDGTGFYRL